MRTLKAILPLIFFVLSSSALGQGNCPIPPAIQPISPPRDIFSDQQEIDLGDAMAESLSQRIKIIEDEELTSYLRALGDRIVQHLPPTSMKYRFYLIELPEVNAFSIAGGRVYISRKMVALTQSDDELAGVVAHELGHIVTHQTSIFMTRRLKEVLGVTQVGDRTDVFSKFHQLMENEARKPLRAMPDEEKGQYSADQVALYAMARAGYAPHAYVDLWDRFQQTHGKTGSWISNLFGETKPAQRRLGEMVKDVSGLPAGCADIPPGSRTAEFAKWQEQVINYDNVGVKEAVPGLLLKQTLALPLRPDISHLHFSLDGKYILAQDEGGIHILTREPFAVLFFIPAVDALEAKFSPDSRSVVFHNNALRVESWSIPEQKRTWVHELTLLHACLQTELSPDGSLLACLDEQLQLSLFEVANGAAVTTKKSFVELSFEGRLMVMAAFATGSMRFFDMRFSPDGHYFVAGALSSHFAWDVMNRREMSLPGSIKDAIRESFAFVGTDRIVGIETSSPAKSPVLRFPSGEKVAQVRLANGLHLRSIARGEYVLVGPLKTQPMGLLDLRTGALPVEFKREAADVFDDVLVSERVTGELALHQVGKLDVMAKIQLPQARLGRLQAAAVSPDLNWMAISNRTRGGVWDVTHNIRTIEMPSFHGAWADNGDTFYVDVAKFADRERQIGRLEPIGGTAAPVYKIGDWIATQYGPYLAESVHKEGKYTDVDLKVHDIRNGQTLWQHHFDHGLPAISFGSGKILLCSPPYVEADPAEFLFLIYTRESHANNDEYTCESRDLKSDAVVHKIRIGTHKGSFRVQYAFQTGDWLVAAATNNQIFTYQIATGEQKGHFFGIHPIASAAAELMAVDSQADHLKLYDLTNSELRQEYRFPDPVVFKSFSPDGKRLFVLTAAQTVYVVDATAQ